jgi:transposase
MNNNNIVVGLDVHKKTIVGAELLPGRDHITEQPMIENDPVAIEKLVKRLAAKGPIVFVYEAGPCGYAVYRQITQLGYRCEVIAPGLTPRRPGDRVKTDRRDAEKLARLFRAGELTVIRIPSCEEEAARDLVRAREDAVADRLRARHRLSKFLLRQGRVFQETKGWGTAHRKWLQSQRFEWPTQQATLQIYIRTLEEAEERLAELDRQIEELAQKPIYQTPVRYLRCLKGIDTLNALTLLAEIQDFDRFRQATGFMNFTGLTGSEYSSGDRIVRGGITKVGNPHVRRALVEAAWHARRPHTLSLKLRDRRRGCPPEILAIAHRAQDRLHRKFWRLVQKGKPSQVAVVACARELAGFVWAMSRHFPQAA